MSIDILELTRARESRAAIERLYIEMRHLFNHGEYRQLGAEGEVLTNALLTLSPEIYGTIRDQDKVELDGLVYVIDRLPKGIESCRFIRLISEEGYADSGFEKIVPVSRRRNCYRIDQDRMFIEVTRGRSEIYDILTHLTFLYREASKIAQHARTSDGTLSLSWQKLEKIVEGNTQITEQNKELALTYLSTLLGSTFEETQKTYERLRKHSKHNNGLFNIIYHLTKISLEEESGTGFRQITFSPTLKTRIGHHIYGEHWANQIKFFLHQNNLIHRPLHIISANLHSVMNCLYAWPAVGKEIRKNASMVEMAIKLGNDKSQQLNKKIREYAHQNGLWELDDPSGTNISVQIIDPAQLQLNKLHPELQLSLPKDEADIPVIFVMDYAFGEQAYETMDELLKPLDLENEQQIKLNVASISIMGKAGILEGGKGDIMVPQSHIFEGTADNYPFENAFKRSDFLGNGLNVVEGPMITVLGTSLQNRDVLSYFKHSSWGAVGLEMEGAHYQKAIQAASKIRKSISSEVILRYAYYASDNPLVTGATLASGNLGKTGIQPTYLITMGILKHIFQQPTPEKNQTLSKDVVPNKAG